MSNQLSVKAAVCKEYERLLKESQVAVTNWNKGRAEILKSCRRGNEADNVLRKLQAKYAKSWALLQYHGHDCELCQLVSNIESPYSGQGNEPNVSSDHQFYN